MKINKNKIEQNSIPYSELEEELFINKDFQKEYLNLSLAEYLEDGDFNTFYRSLEKVIKARGSISEFAKKVDMERANLYTLFKGQKVPRLDTIAKILKELGYTLNVA